MKNKRYLFSALLILTVSSFAQDSVFKQRNFEVIPLPYQANLTIEGYRFNQSEFVDIDQDGDQDLVVSGFRYKLVDSLPPGIIASFLNDGEGNYEKHQTIALQNEDFYGSSQPTNTYGHRFDYAIIDWNGDHYPDLKFRSRLYVNNKKGQLVKSSILLPNYRRNYLDIDLDTDMDYVARNDQNENWIHLNDGNNQYKDSIRLPWKGYYHDFSTQFLDIDGDGDLDALALAEKFHVQLYRNNDQYSFTPIAHSRIKWKDNTRYIFKDMDGDGDLDLIDFKTFDHYSDIRIFKILENTGDFHFEEKVTLEFDYINCPEPTFVDINNDGLLDIFFDWKHVVSYHNNHRSMLYLNEGDFELSKTNDKLFEKTYADEKYVPSFIDIDQDGDTDIVHRGAMLYDNDGHGQFIEQDIAIHHDYRIIDHADIDNDGDYDLLTQSENDYQKIDLLLYKNRANITYSAIPHSLDTALIGGEIIWVNFNGDHLQDIIHKSPLSFKTYLQETKGVLKEFESGITTTNSTGRFIHEDVDHDGDIDLFILPYYESQLSSCELYLNNGQGYFNLDTLSGFNQYQLIRADCRFIDMNDDGFLDIIFLGSDIKDNGYIDKLGNHYLKIYLNNGQGVFKESKDAPWHGTSLAYPRFISDSPLRLQFQEIMGYKKQKFRSFKKPIFKKRIYEETSSGKFEHIKKVDYSKDFFDPFIFTYCNLRNDYADVKKAEKNIAKRSKTHFKQKINIDLRTFLAPSGCFEVWGTDLQKDNDLDLILLQVATIPFVKDSIMYRVNVLYNEQGTYASYPIFEREISMGDVLVQSGDDKKLVDIDHDGDKDIFLGASSMGKMYTLLNNGFKNFKVIQTPIDKKRHYRVNLEDLDGDGDKDVYTRSTDGVNYYYENISTP